jgi:NADPH:quinone reductase-like Zn-dependent oxidoreductase/acyl transferase domain-containing protein/acyl carrier protein
LAKLWLYGVEIDWSSFYKQQQCHRLPLPTYPFERQRYWIDPPKKRKKGQDNHATQVSQDKKPDIADWFYQPFWKPSILPAATQVVTQDSWILVFIDESGLGEELVKRLEQCDRQIIIVKIGSEFKQLSQRIYTLNPQQSQEYDTLLNHLYAQAQQPKTIVHLLSVTPQEQSQPTLAQVEPSQQTGFYSLLYLAQALGKQKLKDEIQLIVISHNLQLITGAEQLSPLKATLLGAVKVIGQEYTNIHCRSIDIVLQKPGSWQAEKLLKQLQNELQTLKAEQFVAYRGHQRWVQTIERVRLDLQENKPYLRKKGVYLITGGLGGIGMTLGKYLAQTVQAKLIITTRGAFPQNNEWQQWLATHSQQDPISIKIRQLQQFEAAGAEVLVACADVTNLEQMTQVITQAQQRFGNIHGVIHAAGVPGGGVIQRKTVAQAQQVLAPKLQGTLVLDTVLKGINLDFFVLCSSLASVLGAFGQVDYSAANAFLDAFAHYKAVTDGSKTVAVNWDTWQEVGMAVAAAQNWQTTTSTSAIAPQTQPVSHPLFNECLQQEQQWIYISKLSPSKHWVVDEHKLMGMATLPGTAYLEMVTAACSGLVIDKSLELRDITFLAPLIIEADQEKEVRTILNQSGDVFEFSIISQSEPNSSGWTEHAKGEIIYTEVQPPQKHDIQALAAKCNLQQQYQQPIGLIEYGPRWHNLKQVKFGTKQALLVLELPEEFAADLNSYLLHPALLDLATGFLVAKTEGVYLPFSYKRLKFKGALPKKIYSYIQTVEKDQPQTSTLSFNITIMDENGVELVEIEEYTLRKVQSQTTASTNEKSPVVQEALHKMEMNDEPPRRQERQELSFSTKRENKIIPQICNAAQEIENFDVSISSPGLLDTLIPKASDRQPPSTGEVEIEVSVTGLNFKDVLLALGLIPVPVDSPLQFGFECAGKIVAVGEGVEGFKVGDEVIAIGRSCFSRFITSNAQLVAHKPKHLTLEEAATIPLAFTTAYTALIHFGRLQPGEKVLIHAATGGVGLAAVQIAQWVGAEIFATAGSPEKREFLHSLGIKYVMNSRSLDFASEVLSYTQNQGVDVLLNSLGGEFIAKGLSVLARYGRFLELGQRDILNNSQLGLQPFEKRLSFFAIQAEPQMPNFTSLWREVVQHFQDGNLQPLPHRVFPMTQLADAFEHMARAKHIGKVVVSVPTLEQIAAHLSKENRESVLGTENLVSLRQVPSVTSQIHSGKLQIAATPAKKLAQDFLKQGILPKEGIDVFQRVLANTLPQVVVSTRDLQTRSEKWGWEATVSPQVLENTNPSELTDQQPKQSGFHPASKNEVEQIIANIWQELLGVKHIGIDDNFFDLGGDSLLIVQVRTKLIEVLQVNIATSELFDYPTISSLAKHLSQEQEQESAFEQVHERNKKQKEAFEEMQVVRRRRKERE